MAEPAINTAKTNHYTKITFTRREYWNIFFPDWRYNNHLPCLGFTVTILHGGHVGEGYCYLSFFFLIKNSNLINNK
jgi:hypothetical protein